MYVPNYVPDPLEVPGNVAEQKYAARMGFVRRVSACHLLSLFAVAAVSSLALPNMSLWQGTAVFASVLVALEICRILTRGRQVEGRIAAFALPVVLVAAAFFVHELRDLGWQTWSVLLGAAASAIYGLLSGRDYSFVGNFFLSLIASSVAIAAIATQEHLSARSAGWALGLNAIFLFYIIYDLASLQSRRRLGEEWAAVTDLYRDVFNVFGYIPRVIRHWHKHRIWNIPRNTS